MNYSITLEVYPINTNVVFSNGFPKFLQTQIARILGEAMRAHPEGYIFSPKYKQKMWDGYIKLYKNNSFPSGLVSKAVEVLSNYNSEYEYSIDVVHKDGIVLKPEEYDEINTHHVNPLRDYQKEAVKTLLYNKRGIAWMATNSGKTMVIGAIAKMLNVPTLVLTNKKELLYQTAGVLEECTSSVVGLVGDGHRDLDEMIVVGMVQTLHTLLDSPEFLEFAATTKLLIIDECHHASSQTMMEVVNAINAPFRFGFSGTPLKNNVLADLQLMAATGDVLCRVSNDQLISEGYSAKPEIRIYKMNNAPEDLYYAESVDKLIVNNKVRNDKIVEIINKAVTAKKVVLVLVDKIEHQENIHNLYFKSYGKTIIAVNGSDDTEYRQEVIKNIREGKPNAYIATSIFNEGVDVPSVDVVIIAGGGKSHIKVLQQIGRGMRRKEGENKLIVIDFYDDGNKYLKKHSTDRLNIYKEENFEINLYD